MLCRLAGVLCRLTGVLCRLTGVLCKLTGVLCRLTGVLCRLTGVLCRLTGVLCRLAGVLCRLTGVLCRLAGVLILLVTSLSQKQTGRTATGNMCSPLGQKISRRGDHLLIFIFLTWCNEQVCKVYKKFHYRFFSMEPFLVVELLLCFC